MEGAYTALITPFKNNQVDFASLEKIIEHNIAGGMDGLVPCGTTGESPTLNPAEHEEVIRFTVKAAKGRVKIIAGTGSNSTTEAVELSRAAEKAGVDGLLLVCPYYNKPTQDGMTAHFTEIAKSVSCECVLYNVPGRTGINLKPETVAVLAGVKNITSIKDATGDLDTASALVKLCPPSFSVISGNDSITLPLMSVGGKGVISVVSNFMPAEIKKLTRLCFEEKYSEARAVHLQMWDLFTNMFVEANPIPVKAACFMMGLCETDELRLPMTRLTGKSRELVKQTLLAAGLKPVRD